MYEILNVENMKSYKITKRFYHDNLRKIKTMNKNCKLIVDIDKDLFKSISINSICKYLENYKIIKSFKNIVYGHVKLNTCGKFKIKILILEEKTVWDLNH